MAEHQVAERAAGDPGGLHNELTEQIRKQVSDAITAGVDPKSPQAGPILDALISRYADTFATDDTPQYHQSLLQRVEVANDPRGERYWHLSTVNRWPDRIHTGRRRPACQQQIT